MDLSDIIRSSVSTLLAGFDGSHDIHHIDRVVSNVGRLATREGVTGREKLILIAAAYLHDVDDHKYGGDGRLTNARNVLAKVKDFFSLEEQETILRIIEGVGFTAEKNRGASLKPVDSLTGIVQDADRLDAIGAHGIARCFLFGGARNRSLGGCVEHFHEKLLLLKDMMKTPSGRQEAQQRHLFLVKFLSELDREAGKADTLLVERGGYDITPKDNQSGLDLSRPPSTRQLKVFNVPLLPATAENLEGYGLPVTDFSSAGCAITPWPVSGWRSLVPGTGDEGGFVEDVFTSERRGGVQYSCNVGLGRRYIIGWYGDDPSLAKNDIEPTQEELQFILTHEANYHPDGAQVFSSRDLQSFVLLLAKPGDDVGPHSFTAFYVDPVATGIMGVHIHAGVWHQPAFPANKTGDLLLDNRQGKVHGCVACDFVKEFGGYLRVPLSPP